mmetsp:Transcript_13609/g.38635  ORF Transcript_13609/g.38635 Transcript_13609/m.38635 type:complete len:497 (+) Transcript_13609:89-1579(+)
MDEDPQRLRQQRWELDWADAKNRLKSRLRREFRDLERIVLDSAPVQKYLTQHVLPDEKGDLLFENDEIAWLGLCEEDDAAMGVASRSTIGTLKVRVRSLVCEQSLSKVYFELTVENETLRSPVAFNQGNGVFVWEFEGRFPITDLTGTFCVKLYTSSMLKPKDQHLGTVIVPFFALLDRGALTSRTAVYAPFPSHTGVPGHRRATGTGLDRDDFNDGMHLTVRHELCLDGPKRLLWPLYLKNRRFMPSYARRENPRDRIQTLSVPQELLASVSELKRNGARIQAALTEILNSLPMLVLVYLRSWQSPWLTGSVCLAAIIAAKWLPSWAVPLVLFVFLLAMCVLSKKTNHENANWVVWNQDIDSDSDDKLSTVQRLARLVINFDRAARLIGVIATLLEKAVNAWNFSDPIATVIMLQLLFAGCVGASISIYVCHDLLGVSFYGPVIVALLLVPIPTDHGIFSAIKRVALAFFDRLPSHDDLGRIWMAKQQTVAAKPE